MISAGTLHDTVLPENVIEYTYVSEEDDVLSLRVTETPPLPMLLIAFSAVSISLALETAERVLVEAATPGYAHVEHSVDVSKESWIVPSMFVTSTSDETSYAI